MVKIDDKSEHEKDIDDDLDDLLDSDSKTDDYLEINIKAEQVSATAIDNSTND